MANDRDNFFAQMRARMAARRGAPLAKAVTGTRDVSTTKVRANSAADAGVTNSAGGIEAAATNAPEGPEAALMAERNRFIFNTAMKLRADGVKQPDAVLAGIKHALQDFKRQKLDEIDGKYAGSSNGGGADIAALQQQAVELMQAGKHGEAGKIIRQIQAATKTTAPAASASREAGKERSFVEAMSSDVTKKDVAAALSAHLNEGRPTSEVAPEQATKTRAETGKRGGRTLNPLERKRHAELDSKFNGDEDLSDEEDAQYAALDKKKQGSALDPDEAAAIAHLQGNAPSPQAAAPQDDPDMMQPEPAEGEEAPAPAAAPPQQEEGAPAPLATPSGQDEDEDLGGHGDQAGEQAEMARQAMQSEGNAEHELPAPTKNDAPAEAPPEEEGAAPAGGAPAPEDSPDEDAGGGADEPGADGPPVEDSPPNDDEMNDPDMMEPEAPEEEEAPAPAPVAAKRSRQPRPAKSSGRTFKVGQDDQPAEQFTPKGEVGGPVTATGDVTGGGQVTRKQGLAIRTEKGPRGGFYEITQTGNRRRISQAEYAERQGKGNKPRHASHFDQNPDAERNGPLDGYTHWHEAEALGHKPFHSSNVEGGRAGMHPSDANREEYHEHLESQKVERQAHRAAEEALTRHAHSYERPTTEKGHYLGKKNLSIDDVRQHIRTLSEFTGLEGKNGHRLSWVIEPKRETIYVNGERRTRRTNEGGGKAFDFDIKEDENGGLIVQPKILTYRPTKKKLSAKQIAYLIATGQIHPVSGRHDPALTKDHGPAVEISADDLKSGNLHKLNSMLSHCAEYAHNHRGPRLNRQLHNLFEAHGATHHNWRYDQLFNTMGRGGSKGSNARPGEEKLAASLEAQRRQLALHLGPNWRAKIEAALVAARHGGALAMREIDGEHYLHEPLLLPMDKALGGEAMTRAKYDLRRVSQTPAHPLVSGVGPKKNVKTGEPKTHNHSPQGEPSPARLRAPKVSTAQYDDVNGGLSPAWRPDRAGYDGMGGGLLGRVTARLKQVGPRGMFDGLVHAHTWSFSSHLPLANVHGGTCNPAEIASVKEQLLDGIDLDPVVVIRHGASYHVIAGEAQVYAARDIGAASLRCFVGTPKASAPQVHTTDIALKIPRG